MDTVAVPESTTRLRNMDGTVKLERLSKTKEKRQKFMG